MSRQRSKRNVAHTATNVCVGIILVGILCLCQPWWMALYENGFQILLVGTAGYIVASHAE